MSESRAAYRYALAILQAAEEQRKLDQVVKDFEEVERLIKDVAEFRVFLRSPVINNQKKKSILTELLTRRISDFALMFILFLTSKNREMILPEVIQQFYRLRDGKLGIVSATVRTAVPFTKEQEQKLLERLEKKTRKKVRLNYLVDKRIKGGFVVQIEDTVWDGSVAHQLEILHKHLIEGSHVYA